MYCLNSSILVIAQNDACMRVLQEILKRKPKQLHITEYSLYGYLNSQRCDYFIILRPTYIPHFGLSVKEFLLNKIASVRKLEKVCTTVEIIVPASKWDGTSSYMYGR